MVIASCGPADGSGGFDILQDGFFLHKILQGNRFEVCGDLLVQCTPETARRASILTVALVSVVQAVDHADTRFKSAVNFKYSDLAGRPGQHIPALFALHTGNEP